jgi:protein-tyrosine phosphatase
MKTILFLCTGNYYRSRFAEELFNYHAQSDRLTWTAKSRALAIEKGAHCVGPISQFVLTALELRCILPQGARRSPCQCTMDDLEAAGRVVALDETEHRPLIAERFPKWENRVEYWQVGDIGVMSAETAVRLMENRIETLVRYLSA